MMRDRPDPRVLTWVDAVGRLHTTSVTIAEIEYGIARLPDGHRKERLAEAAATLFDEFADVSRHASRTR